MGKTEKFQKKVTNFRRGYADLSADERRAVDRALDEAEDAGPIVDIVLARARSLRRSCSDKRTDRRRRELVGAHVPRALAARVRATAAERGVSMYRFMVDTLTAACDNGEG